ncbi:MAG: GspE/PulE/PilB domain-containing protein, partial [Planctomycetota bacterium]
MTHDAEPGSNPQPRFNGEDLARLSTGGESGADTAPIRQRCAVLGIDWLEEAPPVSPEAVALIDAEVAVRLRVVPLSIDRDRLLVAMLDPLDIVAVDEVSALTGHAVTRMGMEQQA